jgi:ankyrin repeat protein
MRNFFGLMRAMRVFGGVTIALIIGGCAGTGGSGMDGQAVINAIEQDDTSSLRAMFSRGTVSVNQKLPAPGYSGGAPLIALAARAGSLEILRFLISAGADINASTAVNETPLMLAAYFRDDGNASVDRHDAAVRLLVESGASLENAPNNYTPLAYAAYNNRQRALGYLIERGARLDADASGGMIYVNTPLMMASIQGNRDVVRMLLMAGADPLIRVRNGHTAREFALKYNHTHITPLLTCAENLPSGIRYAQHCEGRVAVTR